MKVAKYWLGLGVTALGVSGLFVIFLIIGRTSNALRPDIFPPALIVHVNLDVLVWLLAIIASYFNTQKKRVYKLPFFFAACGTALIILSPFIGHGEAYENNYIPIFDNALFKLGIALFLGAIAFESVTTLISKADFKTRTVAFILVAAFVAFFVSYSAIADKTSSHYLYEYMFWGGGHIMQFAYVQIMLIAWLLLADKAGIPVKLKSSLLNFIFFLPPLFVLLSTLFIYIGVRVETTQHIQMFTQQMIYGTGIAAIPLGLILLVTLIASRRLNLYSTSLGLSLLLFLIGGALGNMAAQSVARGDITTIIPAHYHFSSVAVTVALMGYIYSRLNLKSHKWATWQIVLYTIGQICYFTGMAIFGGHGAARKTPGVDMIQMDEHTKKMVEHLMHGGGSFSLIGGIMFVIIVIRNIKNKPHAKTGETV